MQSFCFSRFKTAAGTAHMGEVKPGCQRPERRGVETRGDVVLKQIEIA